MLVAVDLRIQYLNLVLGGIGKHLLQSWVIFQSLLKGYRRIKITSKKDESNKKGKQVIFHRDPAR